MKNGNFCPKLLKMVIFSTSSPPKNGKSPKFKNLFGYIYQLPQGTWIQICMSIESFSRPLKRFLCKVFFCFGDRSKNALLQPNKANFLDLWTALNTHPYAYIIFNWRADIKIQDILKTGHLFMIKCKKSERMWFTPMVLS